MIDLSKQFEKVVLAKLIDNPKLYYDYYQFLSTDLFEETNYKLLYSYIENKISEGAKEFDIMIIVKDLRGKSSDIHVTISDIIQEQYSSLGIQVAILSLVEKQKFKKMQELNHRTAIMLENKDDVFEIIESVQTKLSELQIDTKNKSIDFAQHIHEAIETIKSRMCGVDSFGITTGYNNLDKFTGGWRTTDLIIVGGSSSMGKTSLAVSFAVNAARNATPSVIFSYEMGIQQLVTRIISSESELNSRWLQRGAINDDEYEMLVRVTDNIKDMPLYIDECNNSSLKYLVNRIRQYAISQGVKVFVVDYLQLVQHRTKTINSREQEIAHIARTLKNVAKELDIVVIALSQLNRGVGNRDGGKPTMSDLRESGEIEQAADIVLLIYRPEYYGIESTGDGKSTEGLVELIFAKGRNIGTGTIVMKFQKELTKFKDEEDEL